jgi:hypothetical protein
MEDGWNMEKPVQRKSRNSTAKPTDQDGVLDLNALLHPAQAFALPADVVNDSDLTLAEKRAILASWASDACAVEAVPTLRHPPGAPLVRFDDIMDAIRALDRQAGAAYRPRPHYRRVLEQRVPGVFGRKAPRDDDHGQPLN